MSSITSCKRQQHSGIAAAALGHGFPPAHRRPELQAVERRLDQDGTGLLNLNQLRPNRSVAATYRSLSSKGFRRHFMKTLRWTDSSLAVAPMPYGCEDYSPDPSDLR